MDQFKVNGVDCRPASSVPQVAPITQRTVKPTESRWGGDGANTAGDLPRGTGRVVTAGGMVYITTVGPWTSRRAPS